MTKTTTVCDHCCKDLEPGKCYIVIPNDGLPESATTATQAQSWDFCSEKCIRDFFAKRNPVILIGGKPIDWVVDEMVRSRLAEPTGHANIDAATTDAREPDFYKVATGINPESFIFVFDDGKQDDSYGVSVEVKYLESAIAWLHERKETLGALDPWQVAKSFFAEWGIGKKKE